MYFLYWWLIEFMWKSAVNGYLDSSTQHFVSDHTIINVLNCPGENGEAFGNCAPDTVCPNCNGTCIWCVCICVSLISHNMTAIIIHSHPKRWRVSTLINYISTSFSPSCYSYPSQVFGFSFDTEFVRYFDIVSFTWWMLW